ncbi:(d)CMP kinase [Natranaerobius trueperi]|uniref:Cytidylate kinase n=1 Tax=Natranaerobius trueperi TaxID=759412 RepID=A0A226BVL7_9FIRM|nr:(d)CMP kinase [Natranaerobius trueperi]OWZ82941.1 cytidylate kinase [Natranaerobius trueperi]
MSSNIVIAIDGPAGAGKSTIARNLAISLNLKYLDTGAMYRAIALYVLHKDIDPQDKDCVKSVLKKVNLDIKTKSNGNNLVFLNNQEITDEIRQPEVSKAVSYIAENFAVREFLVEMQRKIGRDGAVLDGRDIGTRIFPNADFKFYLTASIEERTQRRLCDLLKEGYNTTYNEVKQELLRRDEIDQNRTYSPLRMAEDAILLDTTNMTQKEVLSKLLERVEGHE